MPRRNPFGAAHTYWPTFARRATKRGEIDEGRSMPRTVLITGANRGVGLALARAVAARGDAVVGTARRPAAAADLAAVAEVHGLDVTDPASCAALAAALGDRPVDLLVCNAGALIGRGGVDDPTYDAEAFRAVLMANVAGPFFTTRALSPALRRAGGAKVAIISSLMGSSTAAKGTSYLYRASKAAATNIALNLAVELRPAGIAVGAWHPGWVRTDMGGQGADISAEESAAGLLARFDALSIATSGVFEDYRGVPIPI
jgi:NAD(P)-dependent dehydrogenase (short-subunit alcohol dehydrogenase family)